MQSDITKIHINNIIAKSDIVPPFSLSTLSVAFPFSIKRRALSRILLLPPFPLQHVNFSIFNTGSVISRSSRSVSDVETSFFWLRSFLASFELELSSNYRILNVVASANLVPPLNLSALSAYLLNCSYDPSPSLSDDGHEHLVNCITFYFHEDRPHYTALIFPTGNVTLTGFKSVAELEKYALKLSAIISEIIPDHPGVLA